MSKSLEQYLREISARKDVLAIKRQIQAAENDRELQMLMLWEESLEKIKKEINHE